MDRNQLQDRADLKLPGNTVENSVENRTLGAQAFERVGGYCSCPGERDLIQERRDWALKRVDALEIENQKLRMELEELRTKIEYKREESEKKLKAMEAEILELKKTALDRSSSILIGSEELSSSQRFQGLMEVAVKSNLIKNLKKLHVLCSYRSS